MVLPCPAAEMKQAVSQGWCGRVARGGDNRVAGGG